MEYLTTPIYYTNDAPHIGSAYTTLAGDVLARFYRRLNRDVFLLTGTDEHGAKIAEAAEKAGLPPQQFVDEVSAKFKATWDSLNIQPDGFIRTTDKAHEVVVQAFLQGLYDNDEIYLGQYKGWYCISCEEFKTETQIGPNNTCLIHGRELVELEEEAYLFRLTKYQEQLRALIENDDLLIRPIARKNEVLGFITHEGLRDVAISRKSVPWGIQVPWDTNHTVYVWVDALLNYYSASQSNGPTFNSGQRPQFPPQLQLIGKDILRFHALIWPALLLASGQPLPKQLFVHGFFTIDGEKISKTRGNVILPSELIDRYGVDATRYLLLRAIPFGSDGDISQPRLDELYNQDLANNVGNLTSRVVSMLTKYRTGEVPQLNRDDLLIKPDNCVQTFIATLESTFNFAHALEVINQHIDSLNRLIEETKPWELARNSDPKLDPILTTLAENSVVIAWLLEPFIPDTAKKIATNFGTSIDAINYDTLTSELHTGGRKVAPTDPLFPRLLS